MGVLGENYDGLAVGEDVLQLRRRVGELQGHVRAAGLHGGQYRHHVLCAALHVHAHGGVGNDAECYQVAGERVGPPVQLLVGQRGPGVHNGRRLRGLAGLALEELVQAEVSLFHGQPTARS